MLNNIPIELFIALIYTVFYCILEILKLSYTLKINEKIKILFNNCTLFVLSFLWINAAFCYTFLGIIIGVIISIIVLFFNLLSKKVK